MAEKHTSLSRENSLVVVPLWHIANTRGQEKPSQSVSKPTALRVAPRVSLDPGWTSSARGRPCVERVGWAFLV